MNNVWTAIAFRAPCVSRQVSRSPLLQLFHGYARSRNSRLFGSGSKLQDVNGLSQETISTRVRFEIRETLRTERSRAFSNSAILTTARKKRVTKKGKSQLPSESPLEIPSTVVSHTEGLPEATEELTWRDYDPAGGMPVPGGLRSQPEINAIFNSEKIDAETGNYILNVMHWRRISGALIDVGLEFPKNSGVSKEQAISGLEYVRSFMPDFDEQAAGQIWAEEELQRLQNKLTDRAVNLRLYKADEQEPEEEPEEEPLLEEPEDQQGTDYGRRRNQESQLQQIREENEAKFEAKQAERATAEAKAELSAMHTHRGPLELGGGVQPSVDLITYTGSDGITISRPRTNAWLQPVERKPWVKYYEEQAQIIKDNTIPQLSLLRRLGPSFLMLLFVLGSGLYMSENYTPPPESARMWPDSSPAVATLIALSGTITAFFIVTRFPPFWRTLNKYFTLVPAYPYAVSLVGQTFRHQPLSHLVINMASLWCFGLLLHEDVGRGAFLSIFFAAGATGAFASLTYHVLKRNWAVYIFGSSGCVLGVVAAACTLRPNSTFKVFGQEIPIAVWLWLAVWSATEVVAMLRFKGLGIDHAGHVGGLAAGFTAGWLLRQKRAQERRSASKMEKLVQTETSHALHS